MFPVILGTAALMGGSVFLIRKRLSGPSLKKYDAPPPLFRDPDPASPGIAKVNDYLVENFIKPAQAERTRLGSMNGWEGKRERFDEAGLARTDLKADYRDDWIEVEGRKIHGRWTLVDGCDPDRRILYYHGGAFTVGSDISHRPLTVNLAKRTGCAVFAPNYRLMPENSRRDAISDSRAAYHWILDNGPDGPAPVKALGVAGDSAGGNLTLMISNYARDNALREPDAIFALSPSTDTTAASPTFKDNLETDLMLQPLLRPLLKIPRTLLLLALKKSIQMNPSDTDVSPVFADLSDLPPTLVQASSTEMLYGDAVRYVNKALAAGSPVTLQAWSHTPHVFQIFDDVLPEAREALDHAADFFKAHGVAKPK
ncbi:alpha/beta hydrolase [Algimonas porphyrae]|uniref:Hydrolase n=1 Tax=Algimonas porphyrae TaxID=1128113 RepID=A0ABQ5UY84_9PROT|nr:alpha/beta hydrolase [Algimonas porphyrae]GLQ19884.1 hydrolase [Algimonas porphyrae]